MTFNALTTRLLIAALLASTAACSVFQKQDAPLPTFANQVTLKERYLTARDPKDNVDSVATWHGPNGQHWLIATAKTTDRVMVYNASNGAPIQKFGSAGKALGQFERPNGVFVIDDLALIVERDNRRVQVLQLPDFTPLIAFGDSGETSLKKPYGLWVQKLGLSDYRVFVTDNYETPEGTVPPKAELGARVHQYQLRRGADGWRATLERRFGATSGKGVLNIVESIWGDPATGRLLIGDEEEYRYRDVKVYGFDGQFAGQRIGGGVFRAQPEGLALYACADGSGTWFATDQSRGENFFHAFDRKTLEYQGSFSGAVTRNTDGIWLSRTPMPGFVNGSFMAVHDDGNVAAFDLGAVLEAVGVARCKD